jgi:hypothetical protein
VRGSTACEGVLDDGRGLFAGNEDMRMFIFLVAAALAMSFSFYSSANGLKGVSHSAPQAESVGANPTPRCFKSKKMRQTANGGCVMKAKRRSA